MSQKLYVSQEDGLIVRPSGVWIKRKHYYLRRYCEIFTIAMRRKWKLTFLDLFAGPGQCLIKSPTEIVPGSSLIALNFDFDNYVFVENDKACCEALKERCSWSPKKDSIHILQGDCNQVIDQVHSFIPQDHLTFAFIDPTKIDIHFETIQKLAYDRKVDLLMNIQDGMDIRRNFDRYKHQGDASSLGQFLGKNVPWAQLHEAKDAIQFYKSRIEDFGYSNVQFKDIVIKNTKNAPMYFLFFASRSSLGLKFWKEISKRDEQGQGELF